MALDGVVDLLSLAGASDDLAGPGVHLKRLAVLHLLRSGGRVQDAGSPAGRPDAARDIRADVQVAGLDLQPLEVGEAGGDVTGNRQLGGGVGGGVDPEDGEALRSRPGVEEPVVVSEAAYLGLACLNAARQQVGPLAPSLVGGGVVSQDVAAVNALRSHIDPVVLVDGDVPEERAVGGDLLVAGPGRIAQIRRLVPLGGVRIDLEELSATAGEHDVPVRQRGELPGLHVGVLRDEPLARLQGAGAEVHDVQQASVAAGHDDADGGAVTQDGGSDARHAGGGWRRGGQGLLPASWVKRDGGRGDGQRQGEGGGERAPQGENGCPGWLLHRCSRLVSGEGAGRRPDGLSPLERMEPLGHCSPG